MIILRTFFVQGTKYLILFIRYRMSNADSRMWKYLIPATWYFLSNIECPTLNVEWRSTLYLVLSTWYFFSISNVQRWMLNEEVLCNWYLVLGTFFNIKCTTLNVEWRSTLYLVLSTWYFFSISNVERWMLNEEVLGLSADRQVLCT